MTTEEGWHTTDDNFKLYSKTWKPEGKHVATVLFVHGFSDHCNKYDYFFTTLASDGIQVSAWDQRGWGRSVKSPRQKGDSGPTPRVLADITSMLRTLLPSSVPLFLMGHSMGGAEVLTWAAQGPSELRAQLSGVLAESPFVRLDPTAEPWRITVALGRLAGRLAPHAHMVQKLNASAVCRDPEVVKGYIEDPLCHDTGTLEQLAGMLDRAAALDKGAVLIGKDCKALWVSHGSEDHIVIHEASKRYVERCVAVQDKEYKEYPGWFHTLHTEPGEAKVEFARDVVQWISKRLG